MTSTDRPSFIDRQKDAVLAEARERREEHRRVEDIVLGDNPNRRRVTEIVRLGDDYLVQVANKGAAWTFVVGGERTSWYYERQEDAILHLLASRYDSNPNSNHAAAFYAGRVLGLPTA